VHRIFYLIVFFSGSCDGQFIRLVDHLQSIGGDLISLVKMFEKLGLESCGQLFDLHIMVNPLLLFLFGDFAHLIPLIFE